MQKEIPTSALAVPHDSQWITGGGVNARAEPTWQLVLEWCERATRPSAGALAGSVRYQRTMHIACPDPPGLDTRSGATMATFGHLAAGALAGRLVRTPMAPRGLLLFAALGAAPDIDIFLPIAHRTLTHSVGFLTVIAVAVGVGALLAGSRPAHAAVVAMAAGAAVGSHLLLDLLTAKAAMPLLWPFTDEVAVLPVLILPATPLDPSAWPWPGVGLLLVEAVWATGLAILALRRRWS